MPRGRSAASFARERLQTGTDVTPKERVALLKIISMDDRQKKQLQRAKLDAGTANRYTKKPKVAKVNNRNDSPEKAERVLGPESVTKQKYALDKFLDAVRNPENTSAPVAESVPVESVAPPVEPTAPAVEPAPAVIPIQGDKFQY